MNLMIEISPDTREALQDAAHISGQSIEEVAALLLDYSAPLAARLAAMGRDRKEARKHEPRPEFLVTDADGFSLNTSPASSHPHENGSSND